MDVVKVVEAVGAGIMVVGGLGAFVVFLLRARRAETVHAPISICAVTSAAACCSAWRC
jgi:hypothetical protein